MSETSVLLLKSPSKDGQDPYVKALVASGLPLSPICVPILDFEFVNIPDLAQCLSNPEGYSGVILTSPRAVEAVSMATKAIEEEWTGRLRDLWQHRSIFVVGEATAREVTKLGLNPLGAESGNAEALVSVILNTSGIVPGSRPFLFPVSALARDVIPSRMNEAGIDLDQLTIFRPLPHPKLADSLKQALEHKKPSHVVFFSPSGLDFSWDIWRQLEVDLSQLKCVAIGPTTQKALESRGLHPTVASKPTPTDLLVALTGSGE